MRLLILFAMFPLAAQAGGPILPSVPVLAKPTREVMLRGVRGRAMAVQDQTRKIFLFPLIRFRADSRETRYAKTSFLIDRKGCEAALAEVNATRKVAEACVTYPRALEIGGIVAEVPPDNVWARLTLEGLDMTDVLNLVSWDIVKTGTGTICSGSILLDIRAAATLPGTEASAADLIGWRLVVKASDFELPDDFPDDRRGCELKAQEILASLRRA